MSDRLAEIERDDSYDAVYIERAEEDMEGPDDPPALIFDITCSGTGGVRTNGPINLLDLTAADLRELGEALSWLAGRVDARADTA